MTVAYTTKPVLWDVDMKVPIGSLAAIVGPNGAGKSTLLKAMLGLLTVISGSVKFYIDHHLAMDKKDYKKIAYVPQSGSVDWDFPTTVLDVVLMGRYGHLGWFKRPSKKDKELALSMIEKMGMSDYVNRQIRQLSGGQQQRVFLARALVQEADIYLMDEPFKGRRQNDGARHYLAFTRNESARQNGNRRTPRFKYGTSIFRLGNDGQ